CPTHHIEQRADCFLPGLRRAVPQRGRDLDEPVTLTVPHREAGRPQGCLAKQSIRAGETFVLESQKPAVLKVGRGDAPAALKVAIEVVVDHAAQSVVRRIARRTSDIRVRSIFIEGQLHRVEDAAGKVPMRQSTGPTGLYGPVKYRAKQRNVAQV